MINAIVIDDERKGRNLLANVISKYCPEVEVIGEAENIKKAYEVINNTHPDLVFLDIEMPNGNGFDLLKKFSDINFDIIFTTAYDHYAIKAIKYSALDYLLKPIDIDDLQVAVKKVVRKRNKPTNINESIEVLLSSLNGKKITNKIGIPDHEGVSLVEIKDIIRCQSSSNYTIIYLSDGSKITSTRTLKEYDHLFNGMPFMRVHNSNLINLHHIKRFVKGDGGYVILSDDSEVEVSRRRKNELLEAIANI
ncbi:MAG: LytTR family DNA-binding domain-containing protein [Cyclobacteriaceae bacterium]|nr:LytTR family DNA-binding domain-containing protein [Cyclobacteriaceae bacterium]